MAYFICTNLATCERLDDEFSTVNQALDFAAQFADVENREIAVIDSRGQSVVNRERIAARARELGRDLPGFSPTINFDKKL
jgi:hypothetical protein